MILNRRIVLHAPRRSFLKHSQQWPIRHRQMSSAAGTSPISPNTSVVAAITTELDRLAPRIDIRADQIRVIEEPKDFYRTLKEKLQGAKTRIYLSTLYVGKPETELISAIRDALLRSPELKVSILTDALRGTREAPESSSASLLSTLVAEFPERVEIRMYHTPNLTGLRKKLVPKRINEGWGLQHMKLYGIDDEIILSGANLSNDYFTNRQDRYHVFSSKQVSDYFAQIHHAMCSVSFLLRPGSLATMFKLDWPSTNASPSPLTNPKGYIKATNQVFRPFTKPNSEPTPLSSRTDTTLYPLLIVPHALNTELPVLQSLLSIPLPESSSYLFTAGYFNPHHSVTQSLLSAASSTIPPIKPSTSNQVASDIFPRATVITASPWANGFYGSAGVSGMLPAAYTLLSRRFLQKAEKATPAGAVQVREWRLGTVGRPHGWTYHAKGLWLTLTGQSNAAPKDEIGVPNEKPIGGKNNDQSQSMTETGPTTTSAMAASSQASGIVTLIGSSNYTERSYGLDTEVGAVVVTTNEGLMRALAAEQRNLLKHTRAVSVAELDAKERRAGLGTRLAMWIVKAVGGSL